MARETTGIVSDHKITEFFSYAVVFSHFFGGQQENFRKLRGISNHAGSRYPDNLTLRFNILLAKFSTKLFLAGNNAKMSDFATR